MTNLEMTDSIEDSIADVETCEIEILALLGRKFNAEIRFKTNRIMGDYGVNYSLI